MAKPPDEKYRVCVDFDGVIHSYQSPWVDAHVIPDPPVPGAIEWLREMSKDFEVVIFTTRAKSDEAVWAVRRYIADHGGWPEALSLRVTSEKVPALIYLDDRAVRFTGPGSFPTKDFIHAARPWNKS